MLNFNAASEPQKGTPGLVELASNYKAGEIKKVDPMDAAPLLRLFDQFKGQIDNMANQAMGHAVTNDETSAKAAEMAAQARKVHNAIENKRKEVTAPYLTVKGEVDRGCKTLKDQLLRIQRMMEDKNRPYLMKKERERQEAEAKAREDARKKQAELQRQAEEARKAQKAEGDSQGKAEIVERVAPHEPDIVVIPDVVEETRVKTASGTATIKYDQVPVLVNIRKVSDACIKAREKQIIAAVLPWARAQIKAGIKDIPGFRIEKQANVNTRAR